MKNRKIIIVLLLVLVLITGCNNKDKDKSKQNEKFTNEIVKIEEFKELDIIEDNTLETILGINKNFVKTYAIGLNKYNYHELFAVIKPIKGQEETIKTAMKLYIDGGINQYKDYKFTKKEINYKKMYNNSFYKEYKGYQIYIISKDNNKNFKKIKKIIR